jgi:hypothetical protein
VLATPPSASRHGEVARTSTWLGASIRPTNSADRIQKIDPKTGRVLSTIPAPAGGCSGLAWAEGTLWVVQHRDRKIHQIDPQTRAILRSIETNRFVTGVTWIDGELWHGTWEGEESDLRRADPRTGEVLERVEMPARNGRVGARVRWRRSLLLRRRKEREGKSRPPTQAGLRGGQWRRTSLRTPQGRPHEQVVEAALAGGKPLGLTIAWINRAADRLDAGIPRR